MTMIKKLILFENKFAFIQGFLIVLTLVSNAFFPTYSFVFAALAILVMVIYLGNKIFKQQVLYYMAVPFFIIVIFGFLSSFVINSSLSNRDYFRDIFYLVQNVLFLVSGFLVALKSVDSRDKLFLYVVISGLFIVGYNLLTLLLSGKMGFETLRVYMTRGMETVLFACFICLFRLFRKENKWYIKAFYVVSFVVLLAGFIFSFSRTGFILVLLFIVICIVKTKKISLTIVGSVIILSLLALFAIAAFAVEIPYLSYYCKKIASSFKEISIFHDWTVGPNRTHYWRGYEAYSALEQFKGGNFYTMIFGSGFGNNIHLTYPQPLTERVYSDLPIIHNAYLAILVKYGVLGVIGFLVSFIAPYVLVFKKKDSQGVKTIALSILIYLLVSPLFVTSLLSSCTYGSILFLYGFIIAFATGLDNKRKIA